MRAVRAHASAWLMLAPVLVVVVVFIAYPLIGAVATSLTRDTGLGAARGVGLANYAELARDPVFWRATANTVGLTVLLVPLVLGSGLGIALLLRRLTRGRALLQAVFLAPYVVSGVVIALLGRTVFDENVGIVNRALRGIGLDDVPWQSSSAAAGLSVLIVLVWARSGLAVIVYLAALADAPRNQLEAAALDGAGPWDRLRHVLLPHLRPTTVFLAVVVVVETFRTFDVVYVMTGGGPQNATELLVTYSYAQGFDARAQGYGTAIGLVVLAVVGIGTALWWRVQARTEDTAVVER
ncbi:carbohydrate ABC transporter permease [Actinomycetospora sp. CA-084318]|uniref:carbohydrate ABC transporter permease n=1 Tax=Actinomycetospora sp. CA-084318 TaxID=3239892 RepID=UPI003D9592D3